MKPKTVSVKLTEYEIILLRGILFFEASRLRMLAKSYPKRLSGIKAQLNAETQYVLFLREKFQLKNEKKDEN